MGSVKPTLSAGWGLRADNKLREPHQQDSNTTRTCNQQVLVRNALLACQTKRLSHEEAQTVEQCTFAPRHLIRRQKQDLTT